MVTATIPHLIDMSTIENCKYSYIKIYGKYNKTLKLSLKYKSKFVYFHNFNLRCTCNDRDICVFTENKSAQMTYVFTCQERSATNENRFLFPSSNAR